MFEKVLQRLSAFYYSHYKKLMIIPLLLFLVSWFFIYEAIQDDGTPIYRDISLKGGLSATVEVSSQLTPEELIQRLSSLEPNFDFDVSQITQSGEDIGYIVDTDLEEEELLVHLESIFNEEFSFGDNYSSNFISPSLSSAFFTQAVIALCVSFVFMSLVIFIAFREFVPSFAVILSALFDVIVTIGVLNAMGTQISIAGVGSLLMLIGYSIDTDVLLTNRLIKETGKNYREKMSSAFKTGLLMTLTTLIAGIGAMILTNSEVIFEIALILVVGLLVDFISTWLQNTGLLLWWIEKKKQ